MTIALLWAKPSDGMSLDGAIGGRPCNTIAIGRQTDGHPKAIWDKRNMQGQDGANGLFTGVHWSHGIAQRSNQTSEESTL